MLIELFSPVLTVEALWADIGRNCGDRKGLSHFERKFQGKGVIHQQLLALENKSRNAITRRYLRDPTFSRFDTIPACDRHTNRHTHTQTQTHADTRQTVSGKNVVRSCDHLNNVGSSNHITRTAEPKVVKFLPARVFYFILF